MNLTLSVVDTKDGLKKTNVLRDERAMHYGHAIRQRTIPQVCEESARL